MDSQQWPCRVMYIMPSILQAFIGLLEGKNFAKLVIRVAPITNP
jgi:NADPH-dependent curcumin reductase CurA